MTNRKPPSLAAWLLKQLGLHDANEPLVGDLAEEFQDGRSQIWYWRQTLSAIWLQSGSRSAGALIGWAAQVGLAVVMRQSDVTTPRVVTLAAAVAGILLFQRLLRASEAAAPGRRWLAATWNEFVYYFMCYLMFASYVPMRLSTLLWCEILWFIARQLAQVFTHRPRPARA